MITRTDIVELRRLLGALLPGRWFLYGEPEVGMPPDVFREKPEGGIEPIYDAPRLEVVLRFIASTRNILPILLDAAERGLDDGWRDIGTAPRSTLEAPEYLLLGRTRQYVGCGWIEEEDDPDFGPRYWSETGEPMEPPPDKWRPLPAPPEATR